MKLAALDTMVLIWALKKGGRPDQKDMHRRASILVDMLDEQSTTILIPTITIAELLVPIPAEKHGDLIAELRRRFICPPLDLQAASLAADLWKRHKQLPQSNQLKRTILKADVLIIATARVHGATGFYSHDPKCRRLAKLAGLEPHDLPTHHENLYRDHELRDE